MKEKNFSIVFGSKPACWFPGVFVDSAAGLVAVPSSVCRPETGGYSGVAHKGYYSIRGPPQSAAPRVASPCPAYRVALLAVASPCPARLVALPTVTSPYPISRLTPRDCAARGAASRGAASGGAASGGAELVRAEPGGAGPGGAEPEGAEPGGAESGAEFGV
ncbi:unnamed protein product [Closterium sp. NIES-53]